MAGDSHYCNTCPYKFCFLPFFSFFSFPALGSLVFFFFFSEIIGLGTGLAGFGAGLAGFGTGLAGFGAGLAGFGTGLAGLGLGCNSWLNRSCQVVFENNKGRITRILGRVR
jgi:hypothetical protein